MANARRAYKAWLYRRLFWLAPSFLLACGVSILLAADPDLPLWARIPFVALCTGVMVLILVFAIQSYRVVRERSRGRTRQAQLLRSELRGSPGLGVVLLLLLLGLLGVRSLFRESPSIPVQVVHRPFVTTDGKLPVEPGIADPNVVQSDPPPKATENSVRAPEADVPRDAAQNPQIRPEIARVPLTLEDLELPTPPETQDERSVGEKEPGLKHRPTQESDLFLRPFVERHLFSRSGVPSESIFDLWIPPQLNVDFMVIPRSGPWRGDGLEIAFDLPVGQDDSVRLTYTALMLTDDDEFHGTEPSLTWHRGTLEYVRRIVGYTQHATFDLALRIGMTFDRLGTHEASIQFDSPLRISPWFGLETAIWEDQGVGLVAQFGHSPATKLTGGTSRVTDFRVLVRVDLGEHALLELGFRIVSVRFRDKVESTTDDFTAQFDRSFMGPLVGLAFRF